MMSGSFEHGQNSESPRRLPIMVVLFWRHVWQKKYGGLKWWDIDEVNDDEEVGTAGKGARKKKKNEPVKSIRRLHILPRCTSILVERVRGKTAMLYLG